MSSCGGANAQMDGDSVGAVASHSPDCDLLLVCRDGRLPANKCVLRRASSVLRQTLSLQLPTPGELQLPADSAGAWRVLLGLLSLETYPLQLVKQDNVCELMVLADKYDIPVVRGACAHFLHLQAPNLSLSAPLSSPLNVFTAASLVSKYCSPSTQPSLEGFCSSVLQQLDARLEPLRRQPPEAGSAAVAAVAAGQGGEGYAAAAQEMTAILKWQMEAAHLVGQLEDVVAGEEYLAQVAPEVQSKVSSALLAALRHLTGRPPPLCPHCSLPLGATAAAFHPDCATAHFTELHTKGCRLCGVAMKPAHARFCNTCAYRKNKP
ncbi:hypothetical protein Agub_g8611 [Astrephomene gubernaculifera]|uniref:BTB domain-containing protein n=1 Tax=Astrephomene gubernaculifera TaxID=47775 RepID=A0AAD3DRZ7_9CHLO|nr:hypothetical protein Agub_g8611 [Astrephomene gubernaculifera]